MKNYSDTSYCYTNATYKSVRQLDFNLLMERKEALEKMQICQPYKCRGKADLKMTHRLFAKKPSNNLELVVK